MTTRPSFLRRAVTWPIALYRRYLSRLKPPMCRFHPTCSAYAQEAILTHGLIRGPLLAAWRILRCQPFARGGYDPVPPVDAARATRAGEPGAESVERERDAT